VSVSTLNYQTCSTPSLVNTVTRNHIHVGEPSQYITNYQGQLSPAIHPWSDAMTTSRCWALATHGPVAYKDDVWLRKRQLQKYKPVQKTSYFDWVFNKLKTDKSTYKYVAVFKTYQLIELAIDAIYIYTFEIHKTATMQTSETDKITQPLFSTIHERSREFTNKVVQSMIRGTRYGISFRRQCSANRLQNATRLAIRPQFIWHITIT